MITEIPTLVMQHETLCRGTETARRALFSPGLLPPKPNLNDLQGPFRSALCESGLIQLLNVLDLRKIRVLPLYFAIVTVRVNAKTNLDLGKGKSPGEDLKHSD